MKNVKKILALVLALAMALSMAACQTAAPAPEAEAEAAPAPVEPAPAPAEPEAEPAPEAAPAPEAEAEALYTPGTYVGTAMGMNWDIVLDVTFSENAITGVTLVSHDEYRDRGAVALPKYVEQLNEVLDPAAVDCIAGCTTTYKGFLNAVDNAVKRATGEITEAPVATEDETLTADVVVVGGGFSGFVAATAASDTGAEVILIEKLDGPGTCGHSMIAIDTEYTKDVGFGWKELADEWYAASEEEADRAMLDFGLQNSAATIDWMAAHGVDYVGAATPPSNPFYPHVIIHVTTANRNGKEAYLTPLMKCCEENGVKFRFNTTATELIQDETGAVVGVIAENGERTVTIMADSVIMCSGGYPGNTELIQKYNPMIPVAQTASTVNGKGIEMAMAAGADFVTAGGAVIGFANFDGADTDRMGYGIRVLPNGSRFWDESEQYRTPIEALKHGYADAYVIRDSELMDESTLEKALANGSAFKADTIEELAELAGIDAAALAATVERYNGFCDAGVDEDFGKPAMRIARVFDPEREHDYDVDLIEQEHYLLNKLDAAPFYAVKVSASQATISNTLGGIRIDTDGHALAADGSIVPGLYASGECANGQLYGKAYYVNGANLGFYATFSRLAGNTAGTEALAK